MGKKRKASRSGRSATAARAEKKPRDLPATVAAGALVVALLAVGLVVDTGADASFDAPKRLTSLLWVGLAAAALAFSPWRNPFAGDRPPAFRSLALVFAVAGLGWAVLSALLSPHRAAALDAVRTMILYALLLPIGASRAVERRRALLLTVFLIVVGINAVVSILQARGLYQPFPLITERGSRDATGAYVGNVGYLASALALATVAAVALLLYSSRPRLRALAGAAGLLFAGSLLVNRNLTSLSALFVGLVILFSLRRAWLAAGVVVLLLLLGVSAYRPMRDRLTGAVAAARAGDWDRLLTYRVGAWKAAVAMAWDKPLLGYGPGTFGAEFVPHRLSVEIVSRRRYETPLRTSTYTEAHCDYLQSFAESGVPGGLAGLGAVLLLFLGLARVAGRAEGEARAEAVFLLAFLGAGAAAALTWFPMQRPISALPLLLAAGRVWRICGRDAWRVEAAP